MILRPASSTVAVLLLSSVAGFLGQPENFLWQVRRRGIVDDRLEKLDVHLPPCGLPKANYNLVSRSGNLLYLSGHLPSRDGAGDLIKGKLGDLSVDEGYEAAKWCALNLISTIKEEVGGDLDRVEKIVKVRKKT